MDRVWKQVMRLLWGTKNALENRLDNLPKNYPFYTTKYQCTSAKI